MTAETHDAIRDLCVAVAELAALSAPLTGTAQAAEVIAAVGRVSRQLDHLDELEREDG